jgi:hypothetical protein
MKLLVLWCVIPKFPKIFLAYAKMTEGYGPLIAGLR